MRKCDVHDVGLKVSKQFEAFPVEFDVGSARFFATDFDVMPAKRATYARTESFGHGFLGGKTNGDERRWIAVAEAIALFVRQQDAVDKPFAESLPGFRDAARFDQIYPQADNHGEE
jgi:hypothetical protein